MNGIHTKIQQTHAYKNLDFWGSGRSISYLVGAYIVIKQPVNFPIQKYYLIYNLKKKIKIYK